MLSKTNKVTHAKDVDTLSQGNQGYYNQLDQQFITHKYDGSQEYYNQRDQQFIACRYNGGLDGVTIELVLTVILKEEEDGFYQWANNYDH